MHTNAYSHYELYCTSVPLGIGKPRQVKYSRVLSGLLKSAEKRGEVKVSRTYGRITGGFVQYHLTAEQVASVRAEALRRVLCTPMTVQKSAALLA